MQFASQATVGSNSEGKISRETYLVDWSNFVQLYNLELRMLRVRAYNSVVQSIPTGVATALTFDTNEYTVPRTGEIGALHQVAGTPTRFTCPVDGHYVVNAQLSWDDDATGTYRKVEVYRNGALLLPEVWDLQLPNVIVANGPVQHLGSQLELLYGDYLEFFATHDAAGAVLTVANSTWAAVTLACRLL